MKEIILIAALATNKSIGKDNDLLWKLPKDMAFFAETTKGHTVIMGRKTWDSIPSKYRPLPGRRNMVITRQRIVSRDQFNGCDVFNSLDVALAASTGKVFICGGGELYKQALPFATKLILTEVHAEIDGDTFFPDFDKSEYREVLRITNPVDEKHKFSFDFVAYEKNV